MISASYQTCTLIICVALLCPVNSTHVLVEVVLCGMIRERRWFFCANESWRSQIFLSSWRPTHQNSDVGRWRWCICLNRLRLRDSVWKQTFAEKLGDQTTFYLIRSHFFFLKVFTLMMHYVTLITHCKYIYHVLHTALQR